MQPVEVEARTGAARQAECRGTHKRLNLREERPCAFQRSDHGRAWIGLAAFGKEHRRWIGDLDHAIITHLEDTNLVGRAETVLYAAEEAIGMEPIAFEIEDGVYDMFKDARTGDRAFLGDVTHDHHRYLARLRRVHQAYCTLTHLRDATGRGFN